MHPVHVVNGGKTPGQSRPVRDEERDRGWLSWQSTKAVSYRPTLEVIPGRDELTSGSLGPGIGNVVPGIFDERPKI